MTQDELPQLHYRTNGKPGNPPVLFLHGFMGNANDWNEVIQFSSQQYYCLTADLPGHGKSNLDAHIKYSFPNTGFAVIKLLKQLDIKKCFLVGYSMGGRLALFLTLRYPQFFLKTVLESASPGLRTPQEQEARKTQDAGIAKELEEGDFETFLKKWYSQQIFQEITESRNFDKLIADRLMNDPKMLAQALRFLGTGAQPSLWEELRKNKIPVLLLVGEHDIKFQTIAHEMTMSNRFFQTKTMVECSHNIHFQKPEQFAEYIKKFFAKN